MTAMDSVHLDKPISPQDTRDIFKKSALVHMGETVAVKEHMQVFAPVTPLAPSSDGAPPFSQGFAHLLEWAAHQIGGSKAKRRPRTKARCRAIFVSDHHLGTQDSLASDFNDCIDYVDAEAIFLVGDLVDQWALGNDLLPEEHVLALAKLGARARQGTKIIYLPGNHDQSFRAFLSEDTGNNISVALNATHIASDGTQHFVSHGDEYDPIECDMQLLSILATLGYKRLSKLGAAIDRLRADNASVNKAFACIGLGRHRPFAHTVRGFLEDASHDAVKLIARLLMQGVRLSSAEKSMLAQFNELNAEICARNDQASPVSRVAAYDGIICSHTHQASAKILFLIAKTRPHPACPSQMQVLNTGSWVGPPRMGGAVRSDEIALSKARYPTRTMIVDWGRGPLEHVRWTRDGLAALKERTASGVFLNRPQNRRRAQAAALSA